LLVLQAFFYDGNLYRFEKMCEKHMQVSRGCTLSSLKGAELFPCSFQVAFELGKRKLPLPERLDEKKFSPAYLIQSNSVNKISPTWKYIM